MLYITAYLEILHSATHLYIRFCNEIFSGITEIDVYKRLFFFLDTSKRMLLQV